jgi:type II secretory pathway pseudopilin PulG
MQASTFVTPAKQRGISLTGLIFVLAVIGFIAVFAMKVFPTYLEYKASKDAIKAAKASGSTDLEMRQGFDKNADINRIEAITGKDLIISKDSGETELSFAYQKKIPIVANVSLLIDYAATTARSGVVPPAPAPQ